MRRFLLLVSFGVSFWMLSSCSQQYDLATMDKSITVGGENFVFPLGHTSVGGLKVDSLMPNFSSVEELKKDDDGNYYFDYAGSAEREISLEGFRDSLEVECQSKKLKIQYGKIPTEPQDYPFEFGITTCDTATFDYDLSGARKEGLVRLDSIQFKKARISVRGGLSCSRVDTLDNRIKLKAKLSIPSRFHINDSRVYNHILEAESAITPCSQDSATIDFKSVDFTVADFRDSDSNYVFTDSVRLESLKIYIQDKDAFNTIKDKDVKVYLSVELEGGEKGSAYDLEPEIMYGLLDVKADETVEQMLDITGIPDYMRDGVLDLSNPLIRLNLTSNSSVPIRVASDFLSLNLEERAVAETKVELINENVTEDPSHEVSTEFVISNSEIVGEGIKWVYGDIDTLVYTLPKALFVTLDPGTYLGESPSYQHRIHLGDNLKMNIDYNFTLPLQFGSDMMLSFRDTIAGMPDLLRDVMEKNDIRIIGSASSTMPVKLNLFVRMLDEYGKDLGMSCTVPGEIPGTDDPSVPVESEYSVEMKKSSNAKKISMMEMQFVMEDGSGVCLNENNYVKMDIQVSVPGGIELEIKD